MIGLDPNLCIRDRRYPAPIRRFTEPIYIHSIQLQNGAVKRFKSHDIEDLKSSGTRFVCFEVELHNEIVSCVYISDVRPKCDGVIVKDDDLFRYGKILREIPHEKCGKQTLEIVKIDTDGQVADFIDGQNAVAFGLAKSFAEGKKLKASILDVETVSYQCRSLMRIKVSDENDPGLANLVRHLIAVFAVSIEIYQ